MKVRTLATTGNKQSDRKLANIMRDPVNFAKGILGHKVWAAHAACLRAISEHQRVAINAGHASSTTFTAAEAMLWWVTRYTDGIAITTAPKFEQVQKLVFAELHKGMLSSI